MTQGQKLIKTLGLSKFKYIKIHRLLDGAYRTYIIYVDSTAPSRPISKDSLTMWIPKIGVYKFPFERDNKNVKDRNDRRCPTTPLLDLALWNGNLAPAQFMLVDLGGRFGRMNNFLWEGSYRHLPLEEDISLSDVRNYGMSALTSKFRKDRDLSKQPENRSAKLIQCDLNPDNSVTFSWLTEVTQYASPVDKSHPIPKYPKGVTPKEATPGTFELIPDPSKTYTLQIQLVDFMKWLDTYPNKEEITTKDIKDIFDVSSIKLWSTSPSFHWQGMNYYLSKLDGSIYPTDIAPQYWNQPALHGDTYFLDKHLYGLLSSQTLPFFYSPMASMLTKKLRDSGLLPK